MSVFGRITAQHCAPYSVLSRASWLTFSRMRRRFHLYPPAAGAAVAMAALSSSPAYRVAAFLPGFAVRTNCGASNRPKADRLRWTNVGNGGDGGVRTLPLTSASPVMVVGNTETRFEKRGSCRSLSSKVMMSSSAAQQQQETAASSAAEVALTASIKSKADEIRKLKADGVDKAGLAPSIDQLVALKAEFEQAAGKPFDPPKKVKAKGAVGQQKKSVETADIATTNGSSRRITPRSENFSQWYLDVISASEMVENSPVKGCMVIRPWGMAVWDAFRDDMDKRIKDKGVDNAYFPLLIPQSFLTKEAQHVEGFAKECAVVTHHRLCKGPDGDLIPDPEAKLEEPLVVRPTSETIIWTMFRKWIDSYRDLPLKVNQWANVLRWELRTRPFLRSAEFLWQEGHTAHATKEEALACSRDMLEVYSTACRETLALPTVMGVKSPKERFAGADETFTIEALMQNGWALQSGTSHFLGQNFARAFDVYFSSKDETRELVWATSWGVSTRLVGAMIMTHSDDMGLRLPPAVAPKQVVIVPITKGTGEETKMVHEAVDRAVADLEAVGVRVKVDDRPNMRPGAKYFEWEAKGVPLRLELGPRDAKAGVAVMARRTGGEKVTVPTEEDLGARVLQELDAVRDIMWQEATGRLAEGTIPCSSYEEMKGHLTSGDPSRIGMYLVPWTCDTENEDTIQEETKATIRCYPLGLNEAGMSEGKECFYSGRPATHMAIFARAF